MFLNILYIKIKFVHGKNSLLPDGITPVWNAFNGTLIIDAHILFESKKQYKYISTIRFLGIICMGREGGVVYGAEILAG